VAIEDRRLTDRIRPGPMVRRTVHEVTPRSVQARRDTVVTEEPLEIRLGWPGHAPTRVAVIMRTPGNDFELAAGFLLAEGVLDSRTSPRGIAYCVDRDLSQEQLYNVVTVTLADPPLRHPSSRSTPVSSACGVCGTQSLDEVFTAENGRLPMRERVDARVFNELPDALRREQSIFARTGAVHAAGIFGFDGTLVVAREDIGRHNAVDKVFGARQLGKAAFADDSILCASGRIGFDIAAKAAAARIAVIVAVGGPSSLALDLADRAGITVAGFVRSGRCVVYTWPERINGLG
jgi:FdhD protein